MEGGDGYASLTLRSIRRRMRGVVAARAFHHRPRRGKRDHSNISLATNCIRIIVTRARKARLRWKDKCDLIEFYVLILSPGNAGHVRKSMQIFDRQDRMLMMFSDAKYKNP